MGKEKPHLAIWIAIAVLAINQALGAHQNLQSHNQMRGQIRFLQESHLEQAEKFVDVLKILNHVVERLIETVDQ